MVFKPKVTTMMTIDGNDTRGVSTNPGGFGRLSAERRARLGLLALAAFIAASFTGQPVCAQSQSKKVREHVKHATVEVFTAISKNKKGDTPQGSGSGFFVNRTGLCISNNHVVDPTHGMSRWEKQRKAYLELNRPVWTVVVDGGTDDEKKYEAFVLYQNDLADQAIMQVYDEDGEFLQTPHYLKCFPGHRLQNGQKVWCYGFPGGDSRKGDKGEHPEVAISEGHIVDLPRRPDGDLKMIITDALVDPGNSGGPLVEIHGYLIGTATLKPPADFAGRANQSALVPADLTRQFITNAFQRGKLESGIDLEPFYTHLVGRDGFVGVPGYPRQTSTDCLFLEDGNRICGAPVGKTINLPTPLGKFSLPCAQMAYLLEQDDERGIILMDGGQRLPFNRDEAVIRFKPTGGKVIEQDLSEVRAVAFRKNGALPDPPRGKNLLVGGDNYHLLLTEVSGEAKFVSDLGVEMTRDLKSISSIESNEDGERVVHFVDGSKVVGEFEDHETSAVLAVNGAPQKISLTDVEDATFDMIDLDKRNKRETKLADLFEKASADLQKMAALLDEGKFEAVRDKLAPQLEGRRFNKLGELKKDQLRTLKGMCDWLSGDYAAAARGFKKLKRSDDEGLRWFAHARVAVWERFPDGKFDGQPLSDPTVFKEAGVVVAAEILARARELLLEREAPPPENRGLFMRLRKQFGKMSDELLIASQLGSQFADVALVWMWSWEFELCIFERFRLLEDIQEKEEDMKNLQGARKDYTGRRLQREIDRLQKAVEMTDEWRNEVYGRLRQLGFIINDPDLDLLG